MTSDLVGDERAFRAVPAPDERMLRSGRPDARMHLGPGDVPRTLAALGMTVFTVFWTTMAFSFTQSDADTPFFFRYLFPLFGVAFVLSGLYQLVGRFPVVAWRRARTRYAITTRRLLVIEKLWDERLRQQDIMAIDDHDIHRRRDGSGSIVISDQSLTLSSFLMRGYRPPRPFAFE